ncbi:AAA family ATPase [Pantoea agglomerans]|uniref:AAA family ATPase n=1 Tax=Enterobacter agglomerans TaxID=549 RepID=UPI003209D184
MKINQVLVEGFWGVKNIQFELNDDFNFIIGPNGVGKTTILNLITSVFSFDIDAISRIHFDHATINVTGFDNESYSIEVLKGVGDDDDCIINFQILNIKHNYKLFSTMFRTELNDRSEDPFRTRRSMRRFTNLDEARKIINEILNIVWLPIGRYNPSAERDYRSSNHINSVDLRLNAVLENFVKYSSVINKSISNEMAEFQKDALISAIDASYSEGVTHGKGMVTSIDDRNSLMEAFKEVGISELKYKKRVSRMFTILDKVAKKMKSGDEHTLTRDEVMNAFSLSRTRYLVERYNEYKEKKDSISYKMNLFIRKLNKLFDGRKVFYVSDSNEISFVCGLKDDLSLFDLSSGEKQLLILIGEVLLNEHNPCIFIADEPEISLHVSWQEMLVDTMSELNSNMQLIFATHSPDIVSKRTNKIISM